jgi:hypothetical protein
MVDLVLLILFLAMVVAPVVLYRSTTEAEWRGAAFQVEQPGGLDHGPYRSDPVATLSETRLPDRVKATIGLCLFFGVLGLLWTMPVLGGLLRGTHSVLVMGPPTLALCWGQLYVGVGLIVRGPRAAWAAAAAGVAGLLFGAWVLLVVLTVSQAQQSPVEGVVGRGVAWVLGLSGGRLRDETWSVPFSVHGGLGLLPTIYATACLVHATFLLHTSRALRALRALQPAAAR